MKRKSKILNVCMRQYIYTFGLSKRVLQTFALMILFVPSLLAVDVPSPQSTEIKGVVTDKKTGETIIGATIQVKGTTTGVATDIDGAFSIKADAANVLIVSYIGYRTQEITVGANKVLNIQLDEDTKSLDEVVVVGYGVQKKANLTGSVGTIDAKTLTSRPSASVSSMLQGIIPGVTAVQRSGQPGSQTSEVRIRGKSSLTGGDPLVIIDGVPSTLTAMNAMDPQDIENISVLKDAASSAIYGVQAANGVILVTTKTGSTGGRARISYSGSVSVTTPATKFDYLGSADYAMLYNEAVINENPNASPVYSEEQIEQYRNGTLPDTDWYDETFRSHAIETYNSVSINGGSESTSYSVSLGHTHQGGFDDSEFERFNVRSNINSEINHWLKAGVNMSAFRSISESGVHSYAGLLSYANRISPMEKPYNVNGDYMWTAYANPVASANTPGFKAYLRQELQVTPSITINLLPNLSVKGLYSLRNNLSNDETFTGSILTYNDDGDASAPGIREGHEKWVNQYQYTSQVLVNYDEQFGDHGFAALLGFEQQNTTWKETKATRKGGGHNDLPLSLNTLDASSQTNEDRGTSDARRSVFGRVQYNYKEKYLLEGNIRRDQTSYFSEDNRTGIFPAISGAWRITEEDFIKNSSASNWLSNLKLRAGWGQTGNSESGRYDAISTYGYENYLFGNTLYATAYEKRLVNQFLTWATVTNYELGLEAGFFNNKLGFDLTLYKKKTDDVLLTLPQPGVLGITGPKQNAGQIQNTGFDLSVFHNNRIGEFGYNIGLNLAYVKNEIVNMSGTDGPKIKDDGNANDLYWNIEGQPIESYYGFVADGYFNTQDDLDNHPRRTGNEKLGDIKYVDIDGDGDITEGNDKQAIGQNFPSWTAGLNLGVTYKNFGLSAVFAGAFDSYGYYTGEAAYAFFNSGKVQKKHLDRWTPTNHDASYPRMTRASEENFQNSTFWLLDLSYVRLKDLTFTYNIPNNFIQRIGLERASIHLTGENLFTISGLEPGIDPESPSDGRGAYYGNVTKGSLSLRIGF